MQQNSNQHASQHIHLGKQLKQLPKNFVYIINQGVTLQLIQTTDQVSDLLSNKNSQLHSYQWSFRQGIQR